LINNLFTENDIEKAIKETNFNKSLGPDYFDGKLLEDDEIKKNFKKSALIMLNENLIPSYFK
jgi:hypothetical protein